MGKLFAQGFPCPPGLIPIPQMVVVHDTLEGDALAAYLSCLQNGCPQEACEVIQLPPNFVGRVYVGGPFIPLNIQVWGNCNDLRLDTCPTVGDIIFAPFVLSFEYPSNAQITICGPINVEIDVFIKTHMIKDTLPPMTVKLDTLCGALISIDPSRHLQHHECEWRSLSIINRTLYCCNICRRKILADTPLK